MKIANRPKLPQTPAPAEAATGSKLAGVTSSVASALVDCVAMTGTIALETIPFQIKAQGDLWHSDKSLGKKALLSTGLVVGNTVALALSPLIGLGVGAFYGFKEGKEHGVGAGLTASLGAVGYVKNMMHDTFRTSPRKEKADVIAPSPNVKVSILTQDPLVMAPVTVEFPKSMFGDGLANHRIEMADVTPFMPGGTRANDTVKPDADGNYIFEPGTKEFQQVQSFVSANLPLNMYEKSLGRKIPWAFDGALAVHPHAGSGFNAFYARQMHSVNYFDGKDTVTGKDIHGSESMEVTSHEVGHAVLDAMKPGLMAWWGGVEAPAFHEAFGDMTGILTALHQDSVLDKVVAETGGDLRKPNCVARLGEEMSLGINHSMLNSSMPEDWVMRDANNKLKYQDPKTLPAKAHTMDDLVAEPHSFSRIYSGAFWDVVCAVNDQFRAGGVDPKQALIKTRDAMTDLTARALELTPNRMKKLSQASEAMLQADQRYFGGQFHDAIQTAMSDRGLITRAEGGSQNIPALTYDKSDADEWLAKNGAKLPSAGTPLKAAAQWGNDEGETFIRYDHTQEVELDEHTLTDMGASLTVGFDKDGKMFHCQWEPVDAEAVDLARHEVQTWNHLGAIHSNDRVHEATGTPPVGYRVPLEERTRDGQPREKIVRIPVIYN